MKPLSRDELKQLMREAVREEFDHVGISVGETDHVLAAREDFRWLRKTRMAFDKSAGIIGKVVLTALAGLIIAAVLKGMNLQTPPTK